MTPRRPVAAALVVATTAFLSAMLPSSLAFILVPRNGLPSTRRRERTTPPRNDGVGDASPWRSTSSPASLMAANDTFETSVKLPGREELIARMKFKSILDVPSELVEVRYSVPFGLNVEPRDNLAICTKDGPGGEKVGDVLRYTSRWTLGLPRGDGVITTAMSFSGGISWQCSMFDVMKAGRWDAVVEALVSNESSRTNEVVLLFERPMAGVEKE
ncbi:hypothetical protein ACHAXA_006850 [Cyclostephanos tholiformis]|uniref:Uncharacterized protein n=1 Tax=Cyclostephanos tholiformis TaxID=382380 RepID=A0ABD3R5X4_9STRA